MWNMISHPERDGSTLGIGGIEMEVINVCPSRSGLQRHLEQRLFDFTEGNRADWPIAPESTESIINQMKEWGFEVKAVDHGGIR